VVAESYDSDKEDEDEEPKTKKVAEVVVKK